MNGYSETVPKELASLGITMLTPKKTGSPQVAVARTNGYTQRIVIESLEILSYPLNVNRDTGDIISKTWKILEQGRELLAAIDRGVPLRVNPVRACTSK